MADLTRLCSRTQCIAIAHVAEANLFDYLKALQQHQAAVKAKPEAWFPWNYEATLAKINATAELDQAA